MCLVCVCRVVAAVVVVAVVVADGGKVSKETLSIKILEKSTCSEIYQKSHVNMHQSIWQGLRT